MFARCKLLGLLTPHQVELLKALYELNESHPDRLWKPRELGAYRCSHHTKTLKALEDQELVERVETSRGQRPCFSYRITDEGKSTWRSFIELSDVKVHAVLGRGADRQRAQWAVALSAVGLSSALF